jgi:hypothetical protein
MRLVLIASLLLASTTAWAAPAQNDNDADASARRKADPKTKVDARYDFENDNVTGDLRSPEGAQVNSRTRQRHESMIKLRSHFIPQMITMANDV